MNKYILSLIALVAFTISASAQQWILNPATTNVVKGELSTITGLADNTSTNLPHTVSTPIPVYLNPDGSFPTAQAAVVSITGTNAGATNVFTLTFVPTYGFKSGGGTNASTRESLTVTLMAGGLGTSLVSSNLPATFSKAPFYRLASVSVADDAGSFGGYTLRVGGVGVTR